MLAGKIGETCLVFFEYQDSETPIPTLKGASILLISPWYEIFKGWYYCWQILFDKIYSHWVVKISRID